MRVLGDPQRFEAAVLEFAGQSIDSNREIGRKDQGSDAHGNSSVGFASTVVGEDEYARMVSTKWDDAGEDEHE